MTLTEWFALNPDHKCTLSSEPGGVKAVFHGGNGIDQRFVGRGIDEQQAIKHGLEARDAVTQQLGV